MFFSAASNVMSQITSKERDAETGLDYFLARYYSGAQGRFLSVDPGNAGASNDDPQSWNGYAYSRNNPLKYTDPDGKRYRVCWDGGTCEEMTDPEYEQYKTDFIDPIGYIPAGDGIIYQKGVEGFVRLGTAKFMMTDEMYALIHGMKMAKPAVDALAIATGVITGGFAALELLAGGGAIEALKLIGIASTAGGVGPAITFSTQGPLGHGARHLAETGLSREIVETAIKADVKAVVSGASSTGSFWGKVVIQGQTILYKAYTVGKDMINIGTYYPVK